MKDEPQYWGLFTYYAGIVYIMRERERGRDGERERERDGERERGRDGEREGGGRERRREEGREGDELWIFFR